jgi:hypothetical protein
VIAIFPFSFFFHVTYCFIDVFIEQKLLFAGDGEEGQHVTTGERCDERFLRINVFRVSEVSWGSRGRHFVTPSKFQVWSRL